MLKKILLASALVLLPSLAKAQPNYVANTTGSVPPTVNLGNISQFLCVYSGVTTLAVGQAIPLPCNSSGQLLTAGGGGGGGSVTQGTVPWVDDLTQWANTPLGAPSAYGTSPGAVTVPGVNAFITNTVPVTLPTSPSLANGNGTVPTQSGAVLSATNPSFTAVTDGTNGPAAVKAPSTAAVAADKAVVVAVSPNNSITAVQATGTNLHVVCDSGCSSSTAPADESAFTAGTTPQSPVGGFYQTTATSNPLTTGQMGALQVTANRALFVNLRNASGTEIGTASTPVQVSLANTGANATAVGVSAASLPLPANAAQETGGNLATIATQTTTTATNTGTIAGAITSNVFQSNTKQVNGVTTLTGAGATGTGSQRVTAAQDTTTIAGSAPGTAGTASANVVTVQGVASMTPVQVTGTGTAGSAASGVVTIQGIAGGTVVPVSGTVTATVTGVATAANQTGVQGTVGAGAAPANMNISGGVYNSTSPTLTTGQSAANQFDAKGNLRAGNPALTAAAATTTTVATGGTAITAVTGPVNGCIINNPLTATGEGIATAEPLFVSFVGAATTTEGGNVFTLQPGQPFTCPGGFTGNISANAATSSHKFSAVVW